MSGERPGADFTAEAALDPVSLEEALSLVGEETRARILLELGAAWNEETCRPGRLSFSELMERVGAEDSGRFNYHLDRLVGTFVDRDEAGYRLRLPGRRVQQALVSGTLTGRERVEPFPVGGCDDCGGTLTATYRSDNVLAVACVGCGANVGALPFPPRGFADRPEDDVLDAAYRKLHHEVALLRRGVCPGCGGVVDARLTTTFDADWAACCERETFAVLVCEACRESVVGHPVTVALTAPPVVGFFADHDRDAADARSWDPVVAEAGAGMRVVSEDPPRVALPFELDGERLTVHLDAELAVADETRERVEAVDRA